MHGCPMWGMRVAPYTWHTWLMACDGKTACVCPQQRACAQLLLRAAILHFAQLERLLQGTTPA